MYRGSVAAKATPTVIIKHLYYPEMNLEKLENWGGPINNKYISNQNHSDIEKLGARLCVWSTMNTNPWQILANIEIGTCSNPHSEPSISS